MKQWTVYTTRDGRKWRYLGKGGMTLAMVLKDGREWLLFYRCRTGMQSERFRLLREAMIAGEHRAKLYL